MRHPKHLPRGEHEHHSSSQLRHFDIRPSCHPSWSPRYGLMLRPRRGKKERACGKYDQLLPHDLRLHFRPTPLHIILIQLPHCKIQHHILTASRDPRSRHIPRDLLHQLTLSRLLHIKGVSHQPPKPQKPIPQACELLTVYPFPPNSNCATCAHSFNTLPAWALHNAVRPPNFVSATSFGIRHI